jgi:hypothetical protein
MNTANSTDDVRDMDAWPTNGAGATPSHQDLREGGSCGRKQYNPHVVDIGLPLLVSVAASATTQRAGSIFAGWPPAHGRRPRSLGRQHHLLRASTLRVTLIDLFGAHQGSARAKPSNRW